jgi:hypothetical protein
MKRFLSVALAGALVLGLSSVVYANICAFDPVPAATLLFPFVAFDYNNPVDGTTTLFSITNVSNEAQIVHVTLWTDDSVAVLDFNIVLSGYDVQTMNIRDILISGILPVTGTSGSLVVNGPIPSDDGPVEPPVGLYDSDGTNTLSARCNANSPSYPGAYAGGIDAVTLAVLQSFLQTTQVVGKGHTNCAGSYYQITPSDWFQQRTDAEPTWMYITADVVWTCNKFFPDVDAAYWNNEVLYDNVLIGDMIWVDAAARFSEADNALHIEADTNLGAVALTDGQGNPYSFYYRYSTANLAKNDYREPLPTAWAFRYVGAGIPDFDTYLRVWKGSTFATFIPDLFFVGGKYYAGDCLAYTYYAWDEDEDVITVDENPWSFPGEPELRPNLLPLETQEVSIDQFNTVGAFGWMLFIWPPANGEDIDIYQTWMGVKYVYFDYSMFHSGAVMSNYICFPTQVLPTLGVNYDYVWPNGYTDAYTF